MSGRARMLGGMTAGRAVAAQGGAALLARAQMDPLCPDLHALGAFPTLGVPHRGDRSEMGAAGVGHRRPLVLWRGGGGRPKAPRPPPCSPCGKPRVGEMFLPCSP